jgi:hypothetical protein
LSIWGYLDCIYRDTNALIDDIDHFCSDGEAKFLGSWCKTKKVPSVRLSVKDHKPVGINGRHPTWLIVSAHNFTQCMSKLALKSIEKSFRLAKNINCERHTLKNSLALKQKFESMNFTRDNCRIVSLDIKDMYPQCRFKAVKAAVRCFSRPYSPTGAGQALSGHPQVQYGEHNRQLSRQVLRVRGRPRP